MSEGPLLFLVAGEASGDSLGSALMRALREETGGAVRFVGVGGPKMEGEGLVSLFPQAELAVMGFVEVLPRLPRLIGRLRETVAACLAARPAALVTIDSPGFGLRVARRVRAANPAIRTVQYVAPQVWAWRPGRARRMAAYLDRILALLPFEPAFFAEAGVPCEFVGHPVAAWPPVERAAAAAFRAEAGVAAAAPLLLALPGSRLGEITRHARPFGAVAHRLAADLPGLRIVIPTVPHLAQALPALVADWPGAPVILDPTAVEPQAAERRKRAAFAAADAALAASGTVTLELAASGAPMVAAYRTNPLTAAVARLLIKVDTANLVNLVSGERAVPEFLQERFRPDSVADALLPLFRDGPARKRQREAAQRAMIALGRGGEDPSRRAARALLAALDAA